MTDSFCLKILRIPVILVLVHLCSLTLVAQIPSKAPPKTINWGADKSRIIQSKPITFRAFTLDDLKKKQLGLTATSYVTLKKKGSRIRADALIDSMNAYERRLNQWGYSLRDPSRLKTMQGSPVNKAEMDRRHQSLLGAMRHSGEVLPGFARMSATERRDAIKKVSASRSQLYKAITPSKSRGDLSAGNSASGPPPDVLTGGDSQPYDLGDPDLFSLTTKRSIKVSASYTNCRTDVQADFGTSIIGNDYALVQVKGWNTSDASESKTSIQVSVRGSTVTNINVPVPEGTGLSGTVPEVDYPSSTPKWYFWVGPVPLSVQLTLKVSSSVEYYSEGGTLTSNLQVIPTVKANLDLKGGVDIGCAGADIGCTLYLLDDTEMLSGTAARQVVGPIKNPEGFYQLQQRLSIDYSHTFLMKTLRGEVYVDAWLDFWFWSDEWRWVIGSWVGETYQGSLLDHPQQVSESRPYGSIFQTSSAFPTVALPMIDVHFNR